MAKRDVAAGGIVDQDGDFVGIGFVLRDGVLQHDVDQVVDRLVVVDSAMTTRRR